MDTVKEKENNWFLCICVLSVNLISFTGNAGYPWTSPFLPKLNGDVDSEQNPLPEPITLLEESWITSLHSLGALIGLLFSGKASNKFGKKITIILYSIPMFTSNLMLIIAKSLIEFYISRFLLGIGTACVFSVIPAYIAEITEVNNRGKAGMVMPLMAATSHLIVVSIGPYITIPTFACLSLIPSMLFYFIFIPLVPESPYYYVAQNNLSEAEKSLKKLRRKDNIKCELADVIKNSLETKVKTSFKDLVKSKVAMKSLLICFGLILCQQITGIQAVTVYQQEIFHLTGSLIPNHISVIIVGIFQFFAVILVLSIVDKVGRKILFLFSYFGLFLSLISLCVYFFMKENDIDVNNIYWLPLVSIIMHMVFFRIGAGPLCWTFIGEIFPSNVKAQFSAIVSGEMVLLSFLISLIYPFMIVAMGTSWTYLVFATLTGLSIFFIIFFVPEIKGKSFYEIQEMLKK